MTEDRKQVLVTGGGTRIGKALALGLAAEGWGVAVHYNDSEADAESVASEITGAGGRAATVQADLSREDEVQALVGKAADLLGPLTSVVNNASVFERDEALTATKESWDLHLNVNLRAPLVLTQNFARQLPDGTDGVVINLIDQRVWALTPDFTSYTISKAGLYTLTRTLAQALAPRIRVAAIAPGPALKSARQTEENFQRQVDAVPLRRGPALEEFVSAARFILETPSFTGQMIALDGGQHLAWETPDVVGVDN